ncbi:hypothetical protein DN590_11475 [Citrobacter freundii]|nr:hypothetical protein DN590_11475 [Citrobacter freundii]
MKNRTSVHLIISKDLFFHFNFFKLTICSRIKNFVEGLAYDMDIFFCTTGNVIGLRFRAESDIISPRRYSMGHGGRTMYLKSWS